MVPSRFRVCGFVVAFIACLVASRPVAADTIAGYQITADYSGSGDVRLDDTSFIIRGTSFSTNGSMELSPPGSFSFFRPEFFTTVYEDVRTFGYFGLLSTYDDNGDPTGRQVFIAADDDIAGQSFTAVFADYLTTHSKTYAEFVQMLDDGPDEPTPGANTDWIDFNSFVTDNTSASLGGNILTTFQLGDTLSLYAFDLDGSNAQAFGSISVEAVAAVPVPLPTALPAGLALGALMIVTRRRWACQA
jgi:hypothetical protein